MTRPHSIPAAFGVNLLTPFSTGTRATSRAFSSFDRNSYSHSSFIHWHRPSITLSASASHLHKAPALQARHQHSLNSRSGRHRPGAPWVHRDQTSVSIPGEASQLRSMVLSAALPQGHYRDDQAEAIHMHETKTPGAGSPGIQAQRTEAQGPSGTLRSLDVAVIGAGAAGLVAARELLREGHRVVVYEQDPGLGGIWRYDPEQEDDPLGVSEQRRAASGVHSSMYSSLRTNLPRELMGYTDFPFSYPLPTDRHGPGSNAPGTPEPSPETSLSSPSVPARESVSGTPEDHTEPGGDPRRFPGHAEVLRYLTAFARHYGLEKHVRYSVRVTDVLVADSAKDGGASAEGRQRFLVRIAPAVRGPRFSAANEKPSTTRETEQADGGLSGQDGKFAGANGATGGVEEGGTSTNIFDAVVVCNGHYSQPRVADIQGIDTWPGEQMHSHNYRHPDMFRNKVVVVLGAASSGDDISKEISRVARSVHMTSRGWTQGHVPQRLGEHWPNLWYHPTVKRAHEDGSIEFEDGSQVRADIVLHCTGYHYSFPFLRSFSPGLSISNNRVGPLYKHVFPPQLAPGLSLLGLPWKVVPFPLVELQAKWVAQLLSQRCALPSEGEMREDTERLYAELEARGVPQDYTHCLSLPGVSFGDQFDYDDWLARETGYKDMPQWRRTMYKCTSERKRREPWCYRDEFDDEEPQRLAIEEFEELNGRIKEEMDKLVPLSVG